MYIPVGVSFSSLLFLLSILMWVLSSFNGFTVCLTSDGASPPVLFSSRVLWLCGQQHSCMFYSHLIHKQTGTLTRTAHFWIMHWNIQTRSILLFNILSYNFRFHLIKFYYFFTVMVLQRPFWGLFFSTSIR